MVLVPAIPHSNSGHVALSCQLECALAAAAIVNGFAAVLAYFATDEACAASVRVSDSGTHKGDFR